MHLLLCSTAPRRWLTIAAASSMMALCLCALMLAAPLHAQVLEKLSDSTQAEPVFEAPTWAAHYEGQIAGKNVKLALWRLGAALMGSYCYLPCQPEGSIELEGATNARTGSHLLETPAQPPKGKDEARPSGQWFLTALPGTAPMAIRGYWKSMDGKKQWPLQLRKSTPEHAHNAMSEPAHELEHEPALELRLLLDRAIRSAKDCDFSANELQVSGLRIYRQGRLLQTLATDAYGSCGLVQPQWVDANFDGWPDLTQALALPAGPNIPHTTWLYEPETQRFVLGPQALQDITSPSFDRQAQRIHNDWRGSCCSHGVDIYAWKGQQLVIVERAESYVLPVRQSGRLMGCYITPGYARGHVVWPDALYQTPSGLAMGRAPGDWCDLGAADLLSRTQLQVLAPAQAGKAARVQAAYGMSYMTVNTPQGPRYCLDLAVFDADTRKVVRVTLTDEAEERCESEKPSEHG